MADVCDKNDKTRFEMRETQQMAVIWTHVCLCREHKVDYKASQVFFINGFEYIFLDQITIFEMYSIVSRFSNISKPPDRIAPTWESLRLHSIGPIGISCVVTNT